MAFSSSMAACGNAAMAEWISPWTLQQKFPGSNPPAIAVIPLWQGTYPHNLVPHIGLKSQSIVSVNSENKKMIPK